jgi:hypothetical protein
MLTILFAAIAVLLIVVSGSITIVLWAALRMLALVEESVEAEEDYA